MCSRARYRSLYMLKVPPPSPDLPQALQSEAAQAHEALQHHSALAGMAAAKVGAGRECGVWGVRQQGS